MESHKQTTQEIDPREVTVAYLERERASWLPLHQRAQRAGGMNAEFNTAEAETMIKIDRLLDELGGLAIRGSEGDSHE